MPLVGTKSGFWYPRITYTPPGGTQTVIDVADPVRLVEPWETFVGGQNRSESGVTETVQIRLDTLVTIYFDLLSLTELQSLRTFWRSMIGRQFALTLDRFATTTTQWEFDFNTTFTKAELMLQEFKPQRRTIARAIYTLMPVTIRQGA